MSTSTSSSRNSSPESISRMPYVDAPPPYTEFAEPPSKKKSIWKSFFSSPAVPFQHSTTLGNKSQTSVLAPDMPSGIVLYSQNKDRTTRPKPLFERDFSRDHYNPDAVLAMDLIRGTTVLLHQKRG